MKKEEIGYYGKYKFRISFQTMFANINIETDFKHNLITNIGRGWLNNRMASNSIDYIKAIGVGKGTTAAQLTDQALENPFGARKTTTNTIIGTPDFWTKFSATFTAAEMNETTEVGIFYDTTGNNLVARNTHSAITVPLGSVIALDYILGLLTSKTVVGFTLTGGKTKTYEVTDYVGVTTVVEMDTANGYIKKTNTTDVEATPCSYYHDAGNHKTYIHTSDDANPNTHTIIVISSAT